MNLDKTVIPTLAAERDRLSSQLEQLDKALSLLQGSSSASGDGRRKRRKMSPEAKARIGAAQRKRWSRWRKSQGSK
jgi:hypothetical protein